VRDHGLREGADADRHHDEVRAGAAERLVDLQREGGVPVDDPAGHLLVSGPGDVLDQLRVGPAGRERGRPPYRLVVVAVDPVHRRVFRPDRPLGRGGHRARDDDVGAQPEQGGHPRHRPAVVAVGRGDQRQPLPGDRVEVVRHGRAAGPARRDPRHRPGRAEDLERRQAQARRLVLHQDAADPQLGGQRGQRDERGRPVARQRGVEGARGAGRHRAAPVACRRPGSEVVHGSTLRQRGRPVQLTCPRLIRKPS
jgi:hypothetical protein